MLIFILLFSTAQWKGFLGYDLVFTDFLSKLNNGVFLVDWTGYSHFHTVYTFNDLLNETSLYE